MLANYVGFVENLFTPGAPTADAWQDIFLLDADIKSYSLITLEALLQSGDLRMKTENSTFTLAFWWRLNQLEDEQQALFMRLLRSLSFARMSSDFIGSVVALCPFVINSGLLPSILTSAYSCRGKVDNTPSITTRVDTYQRGYEVHIYSKFSKARIDALALGAWAQTPLQFVHGYPLVLRLCANNACYRLMIDLP